MYTYIDLSCPHGERSILPPFPAALALHSLNTTNSAIVNTAQQGIYRGLGAKLL